jgi:hypothetical protein
MRAIASVFLIAMLPACSTAAGPDQPVAISGESKTVTVRGQYQAIGLDRVDRVSIESSKLVLHGSTASVTIDAPASADLKRPTRHWSLVTEASLAEGRRRSITFTHGMELDEFTIELPGSEAPLRFGTFTNPDGEVMVFAWGADSRSYWGYVTIKGAKGAQGARGARGARGAQGAEGARGAQGARDAERGPNR